MSYQKQQKNLIPHAITVTQKSFINYKLIELHFSSKDFSHPANVKAIINAV